MGIGFATREAVKDSLEIADTAYSDALVDQKIDAGARSAEGFLRRRFLPERRTFSMDWPNHQYAPAWRVYLGINEMISLEQVLAGGVDITSSCILRRGDDITEPPYSILEVGLNTGAAFGGGPTFQRSLQITGLTGYADTATDSAAGTFVGALTNVATSVAVDPVSGLLPIGVGSLLLAGTERMVVTGRRALTSGQTITNSPTANQNAQILTVASAANFVVGETILIDAERMRVNDIAGNTLLVARAWDGSTLAAHTAGATVYVPRQLSLRRGVLGSTAAAHNAGSAFYAHEFPPLLTELNIAEAVVLLEQNSSAYARTVGSGDSARQAGPGQGLEDLRDRALRLIGRAPGTRVGAI
jgi:hypothetical protein